MSDGDVPDLASSSDSDVEEEFASHEPQNEVATSRKQITDSGMPMTHDGLLQGTENSGDESESSTDIDVVNEEEDEDEEDDDGAEGENTVAHPNDTENHRSRNQEVEDAGNQNNALKQKLEENFLSCLQQATLAFEDGNYLTAASEYKLALMMLKKNKFESGHGNRFIIRYCLGLSHINQKYNKEIREGERIFQSIVDEGDSSMRVLGYLGLAKAYLKQNRFSEAIQPLLDGSSLISDGVLPGRCLWPGTLKVITETDNSPTNLKEAFEQLLSNCRNPPLPVAVCRYSECTDPVKTQMYLTDPEFKGYVQIVCIEKCTMEFHRECWREMKTKQLDKRSDKELLSHSCITPDCQSTVCRVMVFGPDGKILKMLNVEESSKTKKPGAKYKNVTVHHAKVPTQKKVGGKKAKGAAVTEEKGKVAEVDDGSENRIRLGETTRHRDDIRTHEGGGGSGDGGRGGKTNHRRKSIDVAGEIGCQEKLDDVGRRGPESEASVLSVDPLVTMQRTDFVTLLKKKNEEQDPENLSKKAKKKREKEKPKKTTIRLNEFVDKVTYNDEAFEQTYEEFESSQHSLWAIPPHGSYPEIPADSWLNPQKSGAFGYASTESHSNRLSDLHDIWDVRSGTVSSRSAANESEVCRNASTAEDSMSSSSCSKQLEKLPEVEEDVKGNIMSYFEMFLEKNGPCLTEDSLVQHELEAFPGSAQLVISEAGGIANLLLQSLKFTVVDGYICLLKDAAKAKVKARERRMALLSGSNFFKRFAGGIPINKHNSPTVDTTASCCGNTEFAMVARDPTDEKCSLISATEKKSDELINNIPATVYSALDTVSADEETFPNEAAICSNLPKPVVTTSRGDSAANLNDFKSSAESKDTLFGLSDLNEYKNHLQQKYASAPVIEKYDALDSIEGNSSLSVIEKFKKQVHEAASKERNRARLALTTKSAPVSTNETSAYSKSFLGDGKCGNLLSATASSFGSFLCTVGDIKNGDKKFKEAVEPVEKSLEQLRVVSGMLDIEDDMENEKVATGINKTTKSDAYLFPFSGSGESPFKTSISTPKYSSSIKSTLSATASDFHFPLSSANFRLTSSAISTTAGQKFNPSTTTTVLASRTFHGLDMNSLDYEFGNDLSVTNTCGVLSGAKRAPALTSVDDLFDGFGSSHRNHNGLWVEDKAMTTDQNSFSYEEYDHLKRERDDLSRKYKALAEKQLQLQNRHAEELHIVMEKLNQATSQLENAEKKSCQLEKESQLWKQEKMMYDSEREKLQSDLSYTKASLESANHLVEVTSRLLGDTKNALQLEQDECRSVRDKYESLLNQLGKAVRGKVDRAEILFAPPNSTSSSGFVPGTVDSAGRSENRKPKLGFEKIINMLAVDFPNLSRIELSRCVQEVRMLRNNSLSGLTVQEIVAKVRDFILKEQASKQVKKKHVVDLPYPMPRMVKYNSNNNGSFGGEIFQEEVDPCIICHEELSTEAASMLDCGHSFHTECVRKWFREQSTCPTCRNHALLPDEFPALGRTFFA